MKRAVVKFLPDSNVRFLELKKGSVNLVLKGVEPDLIPAALENGIQMWTKSTGYNVT